MKNLPLIFIFIFVVMSTFDLRFTWMNKRRLATVVKSDVYPVTYKVTLDNELRKSFGFPFFAVDGDSLLFDTTPNDEQGFMHFLGRLIIQYQVAYLMNWQEPDKKVPRLARIASMEDY